MKNGAILHAWMWSFKTITQHMPEIAAAGYTSVQTEPMSKIKEVAANGKKFTENWYYVSRTGTTCTSRRTPPSATSWLAPRLT